MTRKCIICKSIDVYVDVYDSKTIVRQPYPQRSTIDPPKHYCEQHFYSEIWNKQKKLVLDNLT